MRELSLRWFTQLPFSSTPQTCNELLGGSSDDEASSASDIDEILREIDTIRHGGSIDNDHFYTFCSLSPLNYSPSCYSELEEGGFHSDEEVRRIAALFSLFMPPQTAV